MSTKFNSFLSTLGGFQQPPTGPLTPQQQMQQRGARNRGLSEVLYTLSDVIGDIRGQDIDFQQRSLGRQRLREQQEEEQRRKTALQNLVATNPDMAQIAQFVESGLPPSLYPQTKTSDAPTSYREYALTDDTPTSGEYLQFLQSKQPSESLTRFGVYDKGNQIGTVLKSDTDAINEAENKGFVIANLSSPQQAPQGKDTLFDDLLTQHKAVNKIIESTQGLANKFSEEPATALATGSIVQFVDKIVQNIDAVGNFLQDTDNEAYKSATKGLSLEGTDFNKRIQDVSSKRGVSESRIRDLAYLFAAARGQTGRGLSDKDYENALTIVSGGVGPRGRTAVLEDVANRLKDELIIDINYAKQINQDNSDFMSKVERLPEINSFVNPFTQTQTELTNGQDQNSVPRIRIPL